MALTLSRQFQDGMVLQRDRATRLSGRASGSADISILFREEETHVRADIHGHWESHLSTGEAGGPFTLTVVSGAERIQLTDILVGEVWLAGGQSNMAVRLSESATGEEDVARAEYPHIRYLKAAMVCASREHREVQGRWKEITPETAGEMSAVAYYFARRVHHELDGMAVGIIQSAWGGSRIEPWIGQDGYLEDPSLATAARQRATSLSAWEEAAAEYAERIEEWYTGNPDLPRHGHLERDLEKGLHLPACDRQPWHSAEKPFVKEPILDAEQNGVVWFRRLVEIPESMAGLELLLELGQIDAQRIVYYNGTEVSRTTDATPAFWMKPERVCIPAHLVRAGEATIAVRCLYRFAGGNHYFSERLALSTQDEATRIDLADGWQFTEASILESASPAPGREPRPWPVPPVPWDLGRLSSMFNAMIAPFTTFPLRGVIWYQGESNAYDPEGYRPLLTGLIANWRKRWNNPQLAFGLVQLAGFGEQADGPMESNWAAFRQMQFEVANSLPYCGIATALDVGDEHDIHPKCKRPVGERLGGWALAKVYGKEIEWSGPQLREAHLENGCLRVGFTHVAMGLQARHEPLRAFDVMDMQGHWHRVDGRIEDATTVVLDVRRLEAPQHLRYAWGNTPDCDLENSLGLPAFPFTIEIRCEIPPRA